MIYCNRCKAYQSEFAYYSRCRYDDKGNGICPTVSLCCATCGSEDVKKVNM